MTPVTSRSAQAQAHLSRSIQLPSNTHTGREMRPNSFAGEKNLYKHLCSLVKSVQYSLVSKTCTYSLVKLVQPRMKNLYSHAKLIQFCKACTAL